MTHQIDSRDIPFMNSADDLAEALKHLERHGTSKFPQPTSFDLHQLEAIAARAVETEFPHPGDFAFHLSLPLASALVKAERGMDPEIRGAYCIRLKEASMLPLLRTMGLVHVRHRTLTDFGVLVRAELMKDER